MTYPQRSSTKTATIKGHVYKKHINKHTILNSQIILFENITILFEEQYKVSVFLAARNDILFVMPFLDVWKPKWRRQTNYINCQTQMLNLTIVNLWRLIFVY